MANKIIPGLPPKGPTKNQLKNQRRHEREKHVRAEKRNSVETLKIKDKENVSPNQSKHMGPETLGVVQKAQLSIKSVKPLVQIEVQTPVRTLEVLREEVKTSIDKKKHGYFNSETFMDAQKLLYRREHNTYLVRPASGSNVIAELDILKIQGRDPYSACDLYTVERHYVNYSSSTKQCYLDSHTQFRYNTVSDLVKTYSSESLSLFSGLFSRPLPVTFYRPLLHPENLTRSQQFDFSMSKATYREHPDVFKRPVYLGIN